MRLGRARVPSLRISEQSGPTAANGQGQALRVENVGKSFAGTTVLSGVSFSIEAGEVHALVGGNGSGKSTLIKILAGYHEPSAGTQVWLGGHELSFGDPRASHRLGLRVVHQDLGLVPGLSVLDNLLLVGGYPHRFGTIQSGRAAKETSAALDRIKFKVDPQEKVGNLSAAEQVRVAIARALRDEHGIPIRLLVLDEASAALAIEDVHSLLETVQAVAADGVGVLYVTHRFGEVFDSCENVTVLRDGRLVGTRPVAELDRNKLVTLMAGREVTKLEREQGATSTLAGTEGRPPALSVEGLRAGPLQGVDISIRGGEVVGLAGLNGSGREFILGSIFGALARTGGTVRVGGETLAAFRPDHAIKSGMAYLPGDRKTQGGFMDLTAIDNLTLVRLNEFVRKGWLTYSLEAAETQAWFERLQIHPRNGKAKTLETFSGGNQQKVIVAKWLRANPEVILLDEPTQGVDVVARRELHGLVLAAAERGAGVIVSSGDLEELEELCDRVLVLYDGRIVAEIPRSQLSVSQISRYALGGTLEEVPA
jgi:ribose transport system ATP-binding protein